MEGSGRSRGVLSLVALVAVVSNCGPGEQPEASQKAATAQQSAPIPAPPFPFADTAAPRQYLAYADSLLSFAVDDSTSAITRHGPPGAVSTLRVSPEARLVGTLDTAYVTGRIIARIQTDGATSPFNTPVGEAFLWVWQSGSGIQARIITREPGLALGGRILGVPSFYHVSLPDTVRKQTFCRMLDSIAPGDCCRCGSGCWNPWATPVPQDSVVSAVRRVIGG